MGIYASQRNDMQEFLISTSIVALAEMGDKTQLLALLLSARFRKPIPILIAILLATLINHGISAVLGQWITTVLSPRNFSLGSCSWLHWYGVLDAYSR